MKNSKQLITDGTGSFGQKFIKMTLEKFNPEKVVVLSGDEMKYWKTAKHYSDDVNMRERSTLPERLKNGLKVAEGFIYRSDDNTEWMCADHLLVWLTSHRNHIGKFYL